MREREHVWRWLAIGIVVMVSAAVGAFLALRPFITMRPPRVMARRSDDALYHAMPPAPPTEAEVEYVDGDGSTTCPDGFPIKANQRSGIYHLPGDLAYDRTIPARCYRSAEAAEADGFRHALR